MKDASAADCRSRYSKKRIGTRGLLAVVSLWLFCPLAGCQWVFGDYEVVDETDQSPLERPCQNEGQYYCEENALYLCTNVGREWMLLLVCADGSVCNADDGNCAAPGSTSGATTSGAAIGATMGTSNTGIGGTAAQ